VTSSHVYVCVNPAYTEQIFYTQTTLVFESFQRAWATVYVGDASRVTPVSGDQLVVYGYPSPDVVEYAKLFAPDNRWLYVVDESSRGTEPYDIALARMADLNIKNIVLTYQNSQHLEKLRGLGVKYVVMPQCVPAIRPLTDKPHDILVSGQLNDVVYPTRTWLAIVLTGSSLAPRVSTLQYPGCDKPGAKHQTYGDRYYQHLDGFRMAVTCRAGSRDRFVAKYVEFGASHVLPIGDCPTYMPDEMKRAMVNVEGLTDGQVVAEVTRLLAAPDELRERTDAFTAQVAQRYMAMPNMQRVVEEIKHRQTSSPEVRPLYETS
jgi:hypothetical protein